MKSRLQPSPSTCWVEPLEGRVLLSIAPNPIDPRITVPPYGVVTGHVFDDVNGNGIRDAREKVVAGAVVNVPSIYHQNGSQTLMTTYSNGDGEFRFDTQGMGLYIVKAGN